MDLVLDFLSLFRGNQLPPIVAYEEYETDSYRSHGRESWIPQDKENYQDKGNRHNSNNARGPHAGSFSEAGCWAMESAYYNHTECSSLQSAPTQRQATARVGIKRKVSLKFKHRMVTRVQQHMCDGETELVQQRSYRSTVQFYDEVVMELSEREEDMLVNEGMDLRVDNLRAAILHLPPMSSKHSTPTIVEAKPVNGDTPMIFANAPRYKRTAPCLTGRVCTLPTVEEEGDMSGEEEGAHGRVELCDGAVDVRDVDADQGCAEAEVSGEVEVEEVHGQVEEAHGQVEEAHGQEQVEEAHGQEQVEEAHGQEQVEEAHDQAEEVHDQAEEVHDQVEPCDDATNAELGAPGQVNLCDNGSTDASARDCSADPDEVHPIGDDATEVDGCASEADTISEFELCDDATDVDDLTDGGEIAADLSATRFARAEVSSIESEECQGPTLDDFMEDDSVADDLERSAVNDSRLEPDTSEAEADLAEVVCVLQDQVGFLKTANAKLKKRIQRAHERQHTERVSRAWQRLSCEVITRETQRSSSEVARLQEINDVLARNYDRVLTNIAATGYHAVQDIVRGMKETSTVLLRQNKQLSKRLANAEAQYQELATRLTNIHDTKYRLLQEQCNEHLRQHMRVGGLRAPHESTPWVSSPPLKPLASLDETSPVTFDEYMENEGQKVELEELADPVVSKCRAYVELCNAFHAASLQESYDEQDYIVAHLDKLAKEALKEVGDKHKMELKEETEKHAKELTASKEEVAAAKEEVNKLEERLAEANRALKSAKTCHKKALKEEKKAHKITALKAKLLKEKSVCSVMEIFEEKHKTELAKMEAKLKAKDNELKCVNELHENEVQKLMDHINELEPRRYASGPVLFPEEEQVPDIDTTIVWDYFS